MQSYVKYKRYCDKKAKSSPLKEKDCFFILQPKADHQKSKKLFRDFRWSGPCLAEKFINYIVPKLNTNKTQILHRIRLRKYNPQKPPEDNYQQAQRQIDDILLFYKMTYTPLHGRRTLDDTCLTLLSYILTLTQLILMKVTHRDQILLLSRAPILMVQAMVKSRKPVWSICSKSFKS